eukprot:Gb_21671 [translate_table: standard]
MHFDGASKGNPGKTGEGGWIYSKKDKMVTLFSINFSSKTNNVVEYEGLIQGLLLAKRQSVNSLLIKGDSNLVIKQISDSWKSSAWSLEDKKRKSKSLVRLFPKCNFSHVKRLENKTVDLLVNLGVILPPLSHLTLTLLAVAIHHYRHVIGMALLSFISLEVVVMESNRLSAQKEIIDATASTLAKWEAYLIAKDLFKPTEDALQDLSSSVSEIRKDIRSMKDVVQAVSTATIHATHDLAHIRCKLGLFSHSSPKVLSCASSSRKIYKEEEDD